MFLLYILLSLKYMYLRKRYCNFTLSKYGYEKSDRNTNYCHKPLFRGSVFLCSNEQSDRFHKLPGSAGAGAGSRGIRRTSGLRHYRIADGLYHYALLPPSPVLGVMDYFSNADRICRVYCSYSYRQKVAMYLHCTS